MKQIVSLLLAFCLLTACSSKPSEESTPPIETPSAPVVSTPAEKPAETPAEKPNYPIIEAAAFDGSSLAPAQNETLRVVYPTDLFTAAEDFTPLTLFLTETMDTEQPVNINIQKTEAFDTALNQNFLDHFLDIQKNVSGAEALTINVAELRELHGEPVIYMENITQINDEVIDLLLAEGVLTEEMIAQAGGREVFKEIPPTKSVAIYGVVDGYLTVYTGTYYDDTHKQTLIDAMTILFANTEFLS